MPIVNVDTFTIMQDAYGTRKWNYVKEMRKNQRSSKQKCGMYGNGVDLNRNYDIKFDDMIKGASADECNLEYRGPSAFSEPETRAIRDLVIYNYNIVSALNFHAYANMWIHPYSYNTNKVKDVLRILNGRLW